ncbi:MAG TPA: hypothetical protein DCP92_20030 [Nitrospiraceae bacterium]|nr:hypothetical protein [Nitrospiraceae bacterium]
MSIDTGLLRQYLVLGSAFLYWTGVIVQAYRLRRHIGRSPNIRPRGLREKFLWAGWLLVIAGWIGQPLIIRHCACGTLFSLIRFLFHPLGIFLGILLALCGHIGTLWCYSALGDSWRIGINKGERTTLVTNGPYGLVRHPIYLFQMMILIGMLFFLPTLFSFVILLIHFTCTIIKASDEEAYLMAIHGIAYRVYLSGTGRLFPNWKSVRRIFCRT